MTTEPKKLTNIILVRNALGCYSGLIPKVAIFKAIGSYREAFVEISSIEETMRQFKFHVLLDTAVTSEIRPYENGITLIYDGHETGLIEQIDHFGYTSQNGLYFCDNYIYTVAPSVMLRTLAGREFDAWADLETFNKVYKSTNSSYHSELMSRMLHVLSTPNKASE